MRNFVLVPLATLAVLPASVDAVPNASAETLARDLVVVTPQTTRSGDESITLAQVSRGTVVVPPPPPPPALPLGTIYRPPTPINDAVADPRTVIQPAPSEPPALDYSVLQFPAT